MNLLQRFKKWQRDRFIDPVCKELEGRCNTEVWRDDKDFPQEQIFKGYCYWSTEPSHEQPHMTFNECRAWLYMGGKDEHLKMFQ